MITLPPILIVSDRGHFIADRFQDGSVVEVLDHQDFSEGTDKISELVTDQAGRFASGGTDGYRHSAAERPTMVMELENRCVRHITEASFGQKTGAGWYDYVAGKRDAVPNAEVEQMIAAHRASLGIAPRKISDEEIVQRLVLSLVNEGAHIVEEGIASKASDIDMVYIMGYGFPAYRGGPMLYADQLGLFNVVQAMQRFALNPLDDAAFWTPAPLLARLAAEGKTFNPST